MISYLFDRYILIYAFAGLCGLGLLVRFIVNMLYKRLVKESDNPGETKNKMLKILKMKFEKLYKLKIGVNNVDTFVDKNVLRYRFCGVLLSTWENFCGQVLFLILLLVPVSTVFGVTYGCEQERVLLTGSVGILAGAILILVDKSMNLNNKRKIIHINLLDYFENFFKVRLEQEELHPELIEQYRREYFQALESGKQISAASARLKEEPREELNRRREARERKEEERRQQLLRREEEQRRLQQARKEEERRRLEERKLAAQKRREEELRRLEEERKALEAKREELRRRAEQRNPERKKLAREEKERPLHSPEENIKSDRAVVNLENIETEIETETEVMTKERERELYGRPVREAPSEKGWTEAEQQVAATVENTADTELGATVLEEATEEKKEALFSSKQNNKTRELDQGFSLNKLMQQGLTPQEEKIIEDILKDFFA